MCEWLSCREWSDVRLLCGGRSFAAHRAVLASVSAFLRKILLSCPMEDSPTFIVLPDFDFDAMSSVLYYIYNGEVVIQKQKMEMFMEIVKAMQIFVDEQYLPYACKSNERSNSSFYDKRTYEKDKIFCLGDGADGSYINLKKESDCMLLKKSNNDLNFGHKQIRNGYRNKDILGNMESYAAYVDRQRSFLRDLFIETYPRNGAGNGRVAGVPAIQSAAYRAPASQLLTNANSKHLQVDDSLEMHIQTADVPTSLINSSTEIQKFPNYFTNSIPANRPCEINRFEFAHQKYFNSAFSYFNQKILLNSPKDDLNSKLVHNFSRGVEVSIVDKTTLDLSSIESHLRYNHIRLDSHLQSKTIHENDINVNMSTVTKNNNKSSTMNGNRGIFTKNAVLNEVLDSPWRPRQPSNYRPFRKKIQLDTNSSSPNVKETAYNDSNNNIHTSPSPDAIERISRNASTVEPLHPVAVLAAGSDFKCRVCTQVFTNSEALNAHARRHVSPARYTCTECSKSFSQLRNFKYHMSIHRGTREFAATCTVCGKYFNDRGYLSSHMKIHRNRKEYKCPQCPKSFNQRVAYNMHVRIHTGVKPHVCNECGKAFSRKMLLKQHQRTHSGERPYACAHCDKRFADRSNMTLHLRLHTGVKPFSCTLCPKSFTKKHHLKSHLNFHTGAKPYSCPKCKLAFTQSSNMRTHLKKCTAPDPTENADTQNSHLVVQKER